MVLQFDLLNEGRSCCEGFSHDGDQHVQQMDHHKERDHHKQHVKHKLLPRISIVEVACVHVPENIVVVHEPESTIPGKIRKASILESWVIFDPIKLKLGFSNQMEASSKTELPEEQDQGEVPNIVEDLTDNIHQWCQLIHQR